MRTGERPARAGRALLDLLLPSACAGCGAPGTPCCVRCAAVWSAPGPVARGPTGTAAYALARYRGRARRLVLAHKERGRRDLTPALGAALAAAVPHLPGTGAGPDGVRWLVPVPSRRSAARVRGGPHVQAIARSCAIALAEAGLPAAVAPALRLSPGARDAVGLDRAGRTANLAGRLRFDPDGAPPEGSPVLLLDDVLTTGATAAACVDVLAGRRAPGPGGGSAGPRRGGVIGGRPVRFTTKEGDPGCHPHRAESGKLRAAAGRCPDMTRRPAESSAPVHPTGENASGPGRTRWESAVAVQCAVCVKNVVVSGSPGLPVLRFRPRNAAHGSDLAWSDIPRLGGCCNRGKRANVLRYQQSRRARGGDRPMSLASQER